MNISQLASKSCGVVCDGVAYSCCGGKWAKIFHRLKERGEVTERGEWK